MNSNYDKQLESAISRELKALPEMNAPAAVANRVMAAIAQLRQVPWYRRSWETWPVALRMASLVVMLALFGGLCLAGGELWRTDTITQAMQRAGHWFSGFSTIGNVLGTLADSAVLVVTKLGTAFIVACLVAAGLGYATFLGLGTVYFRLALAKPQPSQL